MNRFHSVIALLLCAAMLCSCAARNPDGSNPQSDPAATSTGEVTYCVAVNDAFGNPYTGGVVVNFLQNGQTVAMQVVSAEGIAQKALPAGEYTISLAFTDSSASYHFNTDDVKLTAQNPSAVVTLSGTLSQDSLELSAYSQTAGDHRSYTAHYIGVGCTYVPLESGDRTYLLFAPTESGLYEFSVIGADAQIGYYGMPHFVQQSNLADVTESGSIIISVSPGMIGNSTSGSTILVIGIDSSGETQCSVNIARIGDAQLTLEDYPWDVYQTTASLSPFVLDQSITLQEFDLTAETGAYPLVLNEADGFYHLHSADGPLVFAKLGEDSAYLDSIETVLDSTGVVRYFFDEDGNFLRKESYSECLLEYLQYMDEASGLYPLTEDLMYIFQSRGEYAGWWDMDGKTCIFLDSNGNPVPGINEELAWLFLCCYGGGGEGADICNGQHTVVTDAAKAPTCAQPGLTEGSHCSVCGLVIVEQEQISATGHSFGAWKETEAPTASATGSAERTCSVCGYKETKTLAQTGNKVVGTPSNTSTIELGGSLAISFEAQVNAGEYVVYHLYRVNGTCLTIVSEDAYVIYQEQVYWPENGKVSVFIDSGSTNTPVVVGIGNCGSGEASFAVECIYPLGTLMNPKALSIGSFTTKLDADNDQGYYYHYQASMDGVFTVTLDSLNISANCKITLYNLNSYLFNESEEGTVSIEVSAGDVVQIIIAVYTDDYKYPAATVVCTASIQ